MIEYTLHGYKDGIIADYQNCEGIEQMVDCTVLYQKRLDAGEYDSIVLWVHTHPKSRTRVTRTTTEEMSYYG